MGTYRLGGPHAARLPRLALVFQLGLFTFYARSRSLRGSAPFRVGVVPPNLPPRANGKFPTFEALPGLLAAKLMDSVCWLFQAALGWAANTYVTRVLYRLSSYAEFLSNTRGLMVIVHVRQHRQHTPPPPPPSLVTYSPLCILGELVWALIKDTSYPDAQIDTSAQMFLGVSRNA
ncbi:hypothetical protein B0H13DRAFT_2328541 [Mycena leptocephala]|nr:hypothetical protein B0H13DRAFT_2328541 [Mycena leptocephala]